MPLKELKVYTATDVDTTPKIEANKDTKVASESPSRDLVILPTKRRANSLEDEPMAQNDLPPSSRETTNGTEQKQPRSGSLEQLREYRRFRYPRFQFDETMRARVATNPRRVSGNVVDGKVLDAEEILLVEGSDTEPPEENNQDLREENYSDDYRR
ncbi:hypothetical protein F5X99DRAFT_409354 [Biscogniauxia marginata]|nr:hypothetical protein F5X99DRAFT_409354 [Biscogniauxia marginata]